MTSHSPNLICINTNHISLPSLHLNSICVFVIDSSVKKGNFQKENMNN